MYSFYGSPMKIYVPVPFGIRGKNEKHMAQTQMEKFIILQIGIWITKYAPLLRLRNCKLRIACCNITYFTFKIQTHRQYASKSFESLTDSFMYVSWWSCSGGSGESEERVIFIQFLTKIMKTNTPILSGVGAPSVKIWIHHEN